jgi:hypothetical protein
VNIRKSVLWALWVSISFILAVSISGFCIPGSNDDIGCDPPQPYPMHSEDFLFKEGKSFLQTGEIKYDGSYGYVNPEIAIHKHETRLVMDEIPKPPSLLMVKVTLTKPVVLVWYLIRK